MKHAKGMQPEGTQSLNGVAVVGKRGHLFLKGGSNNLLAQYSMSQDRVDQIAASWHEIISDRRQALANMGIDFLQVFIPEKTTVLADLLPYAIPQTPTPLYARIVQDLSSADHFLDALPAFLSHDRPEDLFGTSDTHTTVEGAQMLAALLADRFDPAVAAAIRNVELPAVNEVGGHGDLGAKFEPHITGAPQRDVLNNLIPGVTESVELLRRHTPDSGFTGSEMHWTNAASPTPLKVMVFGNSFFERGGLAWRLSWWFKHFSREFIFCWSPMLDLTYVEKIQPDVVICQTVERFLTQIPKDHGTY